MLFLFSPAGSCKPIELLHLYPTLACVHYNAICEHVSAPSNEANLSCFMVSHFSLDTKIQLPLPLPESRKLHKLNSKQFFGSLQYHSEQIFNELYDKTHAPRHNLHVSTTS